MFSIKKIKITQKILFYEQISVLNKISIFNMLKNVQNSRFFKVFSYFCLDFQTFQTFLLKFQIPGLSRI